MHHTSDSLQSLVASFRANKQHAYALLSSDNGSLYATAKQKCLKDLFALLNVFSSLQVENTLHDVRLELLFVVDRIKSSDILDRGDIDIASKKVDELYKSIRINEQEKNNTDKHIYDTAVSKISNIMKLPSCTFSPQHRFVFLKQDTYNRRSKEELSAISDCITSVLVSSKFCNKAFKDSAYGWLYDFLIDIKRILHSTIDFYDAEEKRQNKKDFLYAYKKPPSVVPSQLFDKLPDNFIEAGYLKAQKLLEGGQYLAALHTFEALLKEHPNNSRTPYIHEGIKKIEAFVKKPKNSSSVAKPSVQENIGYVSPVSSTKKINPLTGREETEFA